MKSLIILFVLTFFYSNLFCQQYPEDFRINLPTQKSCNSLYSKLSFLDSRYDTTNFGFVLTGATNRKSKVITSMPIGRQISKVFDELRSDQSGAGELLFQLRRLQFYQILGAGTEKGYCSFRASLYAKNGGYVKIGFIDTIMEVKAGDARQPVFDKASQIITDFLAIHLSQQEFSEPEYTFDDVLNIDSIEKIILPVYHTTFYKDGYYSSFQSFKNMMPDGPVLVELKGDKIDVVKTTGRKGNLTKIIYPADVYAIIYNNQPYISTEYDFYPLNKRNGDFVFLSKASALNSSSGSMTANRIFFGLVGYLLEPKQTTLYHLKIDHLTGDFVVMEEVKK